MDDGEIDLANDLLLSNMSLSGDMDEILRSTSTSTCTHTHTCNPPGPDAVGHTHTCYHTHTRVIAPAEVAGSSGGGGGGDGGRKSRKPLGNREAVRKYREKKKAHAAYLEEEVKKLRQVNQQLLKRLQAHAALETEVQRLRGLLFDLRGKIDSEISTFPFQKQCSSGNGFNCDAYMPCAGVNGGGKVGWAEGCEPKANENVLTLSVMDKAKSAEVGGSFVSSASQADS